MPAEMRPSTPVYIDEEHCVRTLGNVIVTYTKAPPSPAYLRAWSAETDRIVRECGDLVVYTVIAGIAAAPSEEAKAEIRRVLLRYKHVMLGVGYAVEGSGFAAAAMRSALTLISLIARYPFPQKIFSKITDASTWVAGLSTGNPAMSGTVSGPQLDALIRSMRAAHEQQAKKAG